MRKILLLIVAGVLGCGSSNGMGGPPPPTNHAPVTLPAASTPSLVMGQSTVLSADAADADGDTLTYGWAQTAPASPQGTFSSTTSASPTWTAPTVGSTTAFTLTVTVSDGRGGTTPGLVTVYSKTSTDPSFIADVQPLLVKCLDGCHTNRAGEQPMAHYATLMSWRTAAACTGQLLVKPGDPDNSVLPKTMAGASCGTQMPPSGPYLGTNQIDLVRTWISQGAANN